MPFDALVATNADRGVPALRVWRYASPLKRLMALVRPRHSIVLDVVRLLTAVRTRIEKPENWCQGHYTDGNAVCLLTALRQEAGRFDANVGECSVMLLQQAASGWRLATVEQLNDRLDHAGLLAAVQEIILDLKHVAALT